VAGRARAHRDRPAPERRRRGIHGGVGGRCFRERRDSLVFGSDAIEESQQAIDDNYGRNLPRLIDVKNRYDPTNLFRLNANIQPAVRTRAQK
jgi:hypothetical protein